MKILCYGDFCHAVMDAGFSIGGGNPSGVFTVLPFDWNQEPPYETPVRWHTGDPETDPWQWRVRVLNERDDIAYAKVFFGRSGYISRQWYPHFLAVRRSGSSIDEDYQDGLISRPALRIYRAIEEHGSLAVHDIKSLAQFRRDEASAFSRALVDLQMRMYITMCGEQPKISATGEAHGWASMVYCRADAFFDGAWEQSLRMEYGEARDAIMERVFALNPAAEAKRVKKFIEG